jgi:hypothetical protein
MLHRAQPPLRLAAPCAACHQQTGSPCCRPCGAPQSARWGSRTPAARQAAITAGRQVHMQAVGAHVTRRARLNAGRERRMPRVDLAVKVLHSTGGPRALDVAVAKQHHRRAVRERDLLGAVRELHAAAAVREPALDAAVRVLHEALAALHTTLRRRPRHLQREGAACCAQRRRARRKAVPRAAGRRHRAALHSSSGREPLHSSTDLAACAVHSVWDARPAPCGTQKCRCAPAGGLRCRCVRLGTCALSAWCSHPALPAGSATW